MLVDIRSRMGPVSSGLRSFVHRARDLSLGRFRHRVREVVVRIQTDEPDAPRRCEVDLRLDDRTHVIAQGRAADLYAAITRAFARAARAVARRQAAPRKPRAYTPMLPARTH